MKITSFNIPMRKYIRPTDTTSSNEFLGAKIWTNYVQTVKLIGPYVMWP